MLTYILVAIAIVVFAYVKRHGFRRAWYIIRTGAENPDWEKLGGDYFLASWEKKGSAKKDTLETTDADQSQG
jgi:hypothetical protein